MIKTEDLIASLAADTPPVDRHSAALRLVVALAGGGAAVMLLIALLMGDPLLGMRELDVMTLGVKLGFTAALLLIAAHLLYRSGRPGHDPYRASPWLGAPIVLLTLLSTVALARAPAEARPQLIFGDTWLACLGGVSLLAVPVFGLIIWAFRKFAPTDLAFAGQIAGLTAGGVAAFTYALHCPEGSPAFILIWYGLGIAAAGLAGRLAGPALLRW